MNKKLILLLICLQTVYLNSKAEIKLAKIFGNHMVLQQQSDAPLWGTASANKMVSIISSWDKKSYSIKADAKGNWRIKVKTPVAGGPYNIVISDGTALTLTDVLIGEVWLCTGQSNMHMPMKGYFNQPVIGSNKEIVNSTNNSIRFFSVALEFSEEKKDDFSGEWQTCTPENVAEFVAAAYYFGKTMQNVLNVPIGLIRDSWGGTRIEPWISDGTFKTIDLEKIPSPSNAAKITKQSSSVLFNAMINPIVGFSMKGVIWYQGESNRNEPENYAKLLPALIKDWRTLWGIGDFPFYITQIAPFQYVPVAVNSAYLREAQLKTALTVKNSGLVSLMDIGERKTIHPANKEITGERLAYLALAKTYGIKGFESEGPELKEMTIDGATVSLSFNHATNGLNTFGKELVNFKVAGEDKVFYPAKAVINGKVLTVTSTMVPHPVAVRYAFDDFVVGELYNTEGLPASSFRTDDWKIEK